MKKISIRSSLLSLLVITSLASYIFLNTVSSPAPTDGKASIAIEQPEVDDFANKSNNLPEITIIKKALEMTKDFFLFPQ